MDHKRLEGTTPKSKRGILIVCVVFNFLFCHFRIVLVSHKEGVSFFKKIIYKYIVKACFSSQVLQMALGSCINQLKAGRPAEEISLPSVHLAYQHFRSRLQNFSRILTIYPPVLQSLTKGTWNHSWAGREMVWPLLGTSRACSQAWLPQATGRLLLLPPWEGKAYGPHSKWETSSWGTHVSVAPQLERI